MAETMECRPAERATLRPGATVLAMVHAGPDRETEIARVVGWRTGWPTWRPRAAPASCPHGAHPAAGASGQGQGLANDLRRGVLGG